MTRSSFVPTQRAYARSWSHHRVSKPCGGYRVGESIWKSVRPEGPTSIVLLRVPPSDLICAVYVSGKTVGNSNDPSALTGAVSGSMSLVPVNVTVAFTSDTPPIKRPRTFTHGGG